MAILQRSLEEPLLSRQQMIVVREIAHAAQLNEALLMLNKIDDASKVDQLASKPTAIPLSTDQLKAYLVAEIQRVLMLIKIPKSDATEQSKSVSIAPGKAKV